MGYDCHVGGHNESSTGPHPRDYHQDVRTRIDRTVVLTRHRIMHVVPRRGKRFLVRDFFRQKEGMLCYGKRRRYLSR